MVAAIGAPLILIFSTAGTRAPKGAAPVHDSPPAYRSIRDWLGAGKWATSGARLQHEQTNG